MGKQPPVPDYFMVLIICFSSRLVEHEVYFVKDDDYSRAQIISGVCSFANNLSISRPTRHWLHSVLKHQDSEGRKCSRTNRKWFDTVCVHSKNQLFVYPRIYQTGHCVLLTDNQCHSLNLWVVIMLWLMSANDPFEDAHMHSHTLVIRSLCCHSRQ